jgi:hypothetical protein
MKFVVEFSDGMRKFLKSIDNKEAEDAFNCQSWTELELEADRAIQALDDQTKKRRNWRNPFEAADKIGGLVARRVEFLIELIPQDSYFKVISGSLTLL